METQEGKNLPVPHCIKDTKGWEIRAELDMLRTTEAIDKVTFGSSELPVKLKELNDAEEIESITFIGLCTDICVISNALILKATFPELDIFVNEACCAGTTTEQHNNAISVMRSCQINII
jgi:nicotinamidase-related amidase